MKYKVIDYINLDERLSELQCAKPNGFSFLPENIDEVQSSADFIFTDTTVTLKKLFKRDNLPVSIIGQDVALFRQRRSNEIFAPTIFIAYTLLSQNPDLVSIGLNVLSSYIYDYFKGTFGDKTVTIDIVIEKSPDKDYKKISYEGSPEDLNKLSEIIKESLK